MVDQAEASLPVQFACMRHGGALPEQIIGPLPLRLDRLLEGPSLDLRKDPTDAVKVGILVAGSFDGLTMCWRHQCPDFVAEPVSLGRPIPPHSMVGATIGGAGIG